MKITQQVLPLPFCPIKPVRVVHGQTDAPYPVFYRTLGKDCLSRAFQLCFQLRVLRELCQKSLIDNDLPDTVP